ncbi:MAG: AAA family ATPase [Myxococcales bacterium]|nr:AAA family ATPase [Myxococcales bacterium]
MSSDDEAVQAPPPEERYAEELAFLKAWDPGPRPPRWQLTPRAVVHFVAGSRGEELALSGSAPKGVPKKLVIPEKFVGERALVERCVVTLAGERGLLLVGEPGTAKSMLSELLSAAISGTSARTVQGTAGTSEEHLRYGWNYAMLLARGPTREALVPSPVLAAMEVGGIARIEEVTRCLPEVQDALVSILSDRRLAVPELGDAGIVQAKQGFNVIATANLRDRGVSEMSAALKRRFNFETVPPINELGREVDLVERQATSAVARVGVPLSVDRKVLEALVTAFRDLRAGRSKEGWAVDKPSTVMSTAEAVGVATSMGLQGAYFDGGADAALTLMPGYLLGVVLKDDPKDRGRLLAYWDGAVKRRAEQDETWKALHELRRVLEE